MQYDVAIVGAGLVGASLAVALSACNLKIALIDASETQAIDRRLFALSMSSVQFLRNIGVWSLIENEASSIKRVHVSRRKHFGVVQLTASDAGLPSLGYMVPARYLESALTQLIQTMPSIIDCYRPMQLSTLDESQGGVQIGLIKGEKTQSIRAAYVFGADGTESIVRKLMGFETLEDNVNEVAIVAEVTPKQDHTGVAYERFYEQGVLAMLPLRDRKVAMILTAPSSLATRILAMTDAEFLSHIQSIFGHRLGTLGATSSRASYPLRLVLAKKSATKRVLLLGNAAHTVYPVAAQGFNLALYEVALLIDMLKEQRSCENIFNLNCVDVASAFAKQQAFSINASRQLTTLSHNNTVLSALMMQVGMAAFEALPFVKRRFLQAMLGRAGHMPQLMLD